MDMTTDNYFNITDDMTDEEFDILKKTILRYNIKYSKFVIPYLKDRGNGIYDLQVRCPHCRSKGEYKKIRIANKKSFALWLICRNCAMRFYAASFLQKVGTRVYPILKPMIDLYQKRKLLLVKNEIFQ